jgi:hypothetical protein
MTDNIDDDTREQLALLMLVWAFLETRSDIHAAQNEHVMSPYHYRDYVMLMLIVRVGTVWRGG